MKCALIYNYVKVINEMVKNNDNMQKIIFKKKISIKFEYALMLIKKHTFKFLRKMILIKRWMLLSF